MECYTLFRKEKQNEAKEFGMGRRLTTSGKSGNEDGIFEPYDLFCNAKSTYRHQLFRCEGQECGKEFEFRAEFVGSRTRSGIDRGPDVVSKF